MPNQTHFGPNLHHRNCCEVSHAHQIVGRASEGEHPVHLENPAMPNLAQQRDRLQPAETFFDSLPLDLADAIAFVPRRPRINRAATAPPIVLRHVRRDSQVPALGHEIQRVIAFVSARRDRLCTRNMLQHHQRRIPLRRSVGLEHFTGHDQPIYDFPPTDSR